jgi:hypothetical protein
MKGGIYLYSSPIFKGGEPWSPPFVKGDRGRIPSGCAAMPGSFLTGPPREANQGGKEGDFPLPCTLYP